MRADHDRVRGRNTQVNGRPKYARGPYNGLVCCGYCSYFSSNLINAVAGSILASAMCSFF